jgi:wyosine [tRNA(Phe)-imidazoG37] synthetase (radical SAM superfamily)
MLTTAYNHLFGPVPSRRLGVSLGIDLVPHKTCNLNCIYCECGRTTRLTMKRAEYVVLEQVREELTHFMSTQPVPDYLTLSGAGEPLLNSSAGELIAWMKNKFQGVPIAVLTNGTLFTSPEVRQAVQGADLVLPSLDAATQSVFRKIDRPHRTLEITAVIQGLVELRQEFSGHVWLEVFIVPGINDHTAELAALHQAITRINPDRIQLNTLDRPGTKVDLCSATREQLEQIIDFWQLPNVEIIARAQRTSSHRGVRQEKAAAILETISRRPCTVEDLIQVLNLPIQEVNKYLGILEEEQQIQHRQQGAMIFYEIKRN